MGELFDQTDATGVAAAIAAGTVSAAEVLEMALARIEARNPAINAIVSRRDETARAEVAAGLPQGPLHGVPIVIKDLGATVAGMPSTRGSRLWADAVATEDSALVARYRAAGAVIVGMTNTPELGKNASTEPLLHGPTRNPRRLTHSAGGSSGGTAAAVAAGIVPTGHGNDGGGSIRIPASENGLIGLKPSRGRVTSAPAQWMFAYPLAINHALARSVRDSALMLDVAQGPQRGDPYVIPPPLRPYVDEVGADPGRLRVALCTTMPDGSPVDAPCAAAAQAAAALLERLGHHVEPAVPDWPVEDLGTTMRVMMEAPQVREVDVRLAELGRPGQLTDDDLEPMTRAIYEHGMALRGVDVTDALEALEGIAHRLGALFGTYDLLLTPTIARTVPQLGVLDTTDLMAMYEHAGAFSALTAPFNMSGQPAISLPLGTDPDGMPVGVQLVAAFGREDLLLRVASQVEATGAWDTTPVDPTRH